MNLINNQLTLMNNSDKNERVVLQISPLKIIEGGHKVEMQLSPVLSNSKHDSYILRLLSFSDYNIKKTSDKIRDYLSGIIKEEKTKDALLLLHDLLVQSEIRGKSRQQFPSWMAFTNEENIDKFKFDKPLTEQEQNYLQELGTLISPFIYFSANQFQANIIDILDVKIADYTHLVMNIPHSTSLLMSFLPTANK